LWCEPRDTRARGAGFGTALMTTIELFEGTKCLTLSFPTKRALVSG